MSDNINPGNYFHEEVCEQLLSWLPPVTLIRCSAVCKMWHQIFKNKQFLKLHRRRSTKFLIGVPRRYVKSPQPYQEGELFKDRLTVHVDDASFDVVGEFNHTFLFSYYCNVVGCSNGVFLITNVDYKTLKILMWNPSIRKYAIIPTKELEQELEQEIGESQELVFGLFYSSCTDDYRIILIFYEFYNASAPLFVKIFSLNSRTWSAYTKPVPRYHLACSWSQVNVNNALHWFAKDKSGPNMIIAFKLHDEVFCGIPLPPDVVNHRIIEPIQLNDCLAIYTNDLKEEIQLWVMPNYGNTESWTFLLKLKIEDFILGITFRLTKEHCVEFFHFSEKKEELLCYNCEKKDTRTLDISCCDAPQMGFFTESMGLYSESRYVVMSNEETHRSGRFIAELVKICMKSLDKMLSAEEHSVAVLPDPASKTLTIRDNGMGITERELLNSLDIWEDFGSSEKDTMMVILFGDLKHLLHKVIVSTTEDQYVMLAQPGGTLSLRKDTGGEVLARGTKVVVHLDDDLAEYCLDERVLTTLLNKYLDCTRYAFRVGSSVDE